MGNRKSDVRVYGVPAKLFSKSKLMTIYLTEDGLFATQLGKRYPRWITKPSLSALVKEINKTKIDPPIKLLDLDGWEYQKEARILEIAQVAKNGTFELSGRKVGGRFGHLNRYYDYDAAIVRKLNSLYAARKKAIDKINKEIKGVVATAKPFVFGTNPIAE